MVNPYLYEYSGGEDNSYIFVTDKEIVYEVMFRPSGYIFGVESPYFEDTFELIIGILEKPQPEKPSLDSRIPITIASIFKDFFHSREQLVVFVCDSSDKKEEARFRKFNRWFEYYRGVEFMKIDVLIPDDAGFI